MWCQNKRWYIRGLLHKFSNFFYVKILSPQSTNVHLIERKKQAQGRPDMINAKHFAIEEGGGVVEKIQRFGIVK